VNAGSYAVLASFAGNTQYAAVSVTATLTITRATPTVTISGAGEVEFDGQPHGVTAAVLGVPGETLGPATVTYNGAPTPPTQAGTYAVLATYPGAANYNAASATATLTITGGPREACILVDFREITYFRDSRVLTSSDAGIRARNGLHGGFAPGLWPYDPRGRGDSTASRGTLFRIYGFAADQVGVRVPDADVPARSYPVRVDHDIPGAYYVDLGGPAAVIVCVSQLQKAIIDDDRVARDENLPGSVVLTSAQKNVPGIMLSHNSAVIDVPRRVRDDLRTLGTPLRDARGRELDRGLIDYVAFQLWGGGAARYREFVDVEIVFVDDSPVDLAAHYAFGFLTAKNSSFETFAGCNYLDHAPGNDGVRFTDVWSERFDASDARACGRREPADNQDVRENYDVPFGAIQILPSVNTASDTVRLFFGAIRAPRK
jgi:hypothetical protein